ncbi:discoidin domain-containing protein [Streptomyces sp. MSC1_001]|uniref:discoidin domain-containing protein n=1 Tax=Streptomyces sp. MSC1_001 TaxID=2909263 RepID=UPI00202DCA64|nr:discoidin domain-containing protein [Streptomyces sp. MSC1_001]
MDTPLPRDPLSRRNILRGGSSLVFAAAIGFGSGPAATASALTGEVPAATPPDPGPYYSYSPNIKVDGSPFPDLAQGKPSFSDSFVTGGDVPFNGNDDYPASAWLAADQKATTWWKVDLQGYFDLTGTRITWPAERGTYAYRIDVSTDGVTWRKAVDQVDDDLGTRVRDDAFGATDVRFVRVTLRTLGGGPAGFCDFKAFGQLRAGSDIALGKIAYASTGKKASNAVDGSATTSWVAEGLFWRVDLQGKYDVTGAEVTWVADTLYRYTIDVSADGSAWKTVADRSDNLERSRTQTATFSEQAVRFVRLRMIGADDKEQAGFSGLKVFGKISPETDVALGKPATASSGGSVGHANDGDPRTYWIASDGERHWWQVDLEEPHDLNTVRTTWERNDVPYRFTVDASVDGRDWVQIVDRSTGTTTAQPYVDTVTAKGVRHVRVTFLNADGWWAALRACELLGVPSAGGANGGDVAQGKATYTNDTTSYRDAAKGNDGDASTSFVFADYGIPYEYRVDLLVPMNIRAVEIEWDGFGTSSPYAIEVSEDARIWRSLSKGTAQQVTKDRVQARKTRFVRVRVPSTGDCYGSGIRHFRVRGARPEAANLGAGRPLRKGEAGGLPCWKIDFPGLAEIESVTIGWKYPKRSDAYSVEVSSDDHTWVPAGSFRREGTSVETEHRLSAHHIRFLRVVGPKAAKGRAPEVTRLRVMGRITRDESVLEQEERKSFDYFWNAANSRVDSGGYGLISESTGHEAEATSVSGTGFGLAALVVGAARGWVTPDKAYERALGTLDTLLGLKRVHGVFFHYYNCANGEVWRWPAPDGLSEVGLIDTQLMLNGVILAGEYFGGKVKERADRIYREVDWSAFRDPATNHFRMSWFTETNEFKYSWDRSSEGKLMYVLGAGSPTHPVGKEMFDAFERERGTYGAYPDFILTWFGSLFTYQFAETFVDFRNSKDGLGTDWWRNSVLATKTNRAYAADEAESFRTFGPDAWGMTACNTKNLSDTGKDVAYVSTYGAPPSGNRSTAHHNDGTLSPDGAAGSVPMDPEYATRVLDNFFYNYPESWGEYGFVNAVNLDLQPAWYAGGELALDKGIAVLAIENNRSGLIWRLFMQNEHVIRGLKALGIAYSPDRTPLEVAIAAARITADRATHGEERARRDQAVLAKIAAAIDTAEEALVGAGTHTEITLATQRLKEAIAVLE